MRNLTMLTDLYQMTMMNGYINAGIGHCILGYAAQEPAPAKPRKADFIVRVDRNR